MTDLGYCRLCAEIKTFSTLIVINKNENDSNINLCDKIAQCFQIQILPEDNLPKTICLDCCSQTNVTYEFCQKVHKAQEFLRKIIFNSAIHKLNTGFQNSSNEMVVKDEIRTKNESNIKSENQNNSIIIPKVEISDVPFHNTILLSPTPEQFSSAEDDSELVQNTKSDKPVRKNQKTSSGAKFTRKNVWKDFTWPCNKCQNEFETRKDLVDHFADVHGGSPEYKCPECSKCYTKYSMFTQHLRVHKNYQKFSCHICSKAFNVNAHLQKHLNLYHEQNPLAKKVCQECGRAFKSQISLQYHMKYAHGPADENSKYECDICNKKITTKAGLKTHKNTHDESTKTHMCDQCGLSFRLKSSLRYHMDNVHGDVKEDNYLQCPLCPKKLKHKIQLQRHHRQIHTDKRFECESCGKKFYLQTSYTVHLRLHTGERPFECQYCKKRFRQKPNLENHVRQHTGEKPYKCTDCNHDFTDLSNYIKHMRRKHGVTSFKNVKKFC